jgi:hypothetical protein
MVLYFLSPMTETASVLKALLARLSVFKRSPPIASAAAYGEFLATRAAFVSQKKLYEYVKQRMGMSYPRHFQDDAFIGSLNIAKWQVYAACLSDLAVWMAAQTHKRTMDDKEAQAIANYWYSTVVDDRFPTCGLPGGTGPILESFANRLALTDWRAKAVRDYAFSLSPKELVRWAPIAPELKKYDVEVVENSIRFAWVAIREDFNRVYDHDAFIVDWRRSFPRGDPVA